MTHYSRLIIILAPLLLAGCAWFQDESAGIDPELKRNQQLQQEAATLRSEVKQKQAELDALKEQ